MSFNLLTATDEQKRTYWGDYESFEQELEVLIPIWEQEFLEELMSKQFEEENSL